MFRNVLIATVLTTQSVAADGYVADAFGIVPAEHMSAERAHWAGARNTATATEVQSAEDAAIALLFLGPKSVVAGADDLHAVALVLDRHGNLGSGDAPVTFTLNGTRVPGSALKYGIGAHIHRPDPVAGTYVGAAQVNSVQSPRGTYRVTPDLTSAAVELIPPPQALRTETLARFESQPMRDRFGNLVEDGTGTEFLLRHKGGRVSQMSATVVDGVARSWFLTRDVDTGGVLQATTSAAAAAPVPVQLETLVAPEPAAVILWPVPQIGAVKLRAGPFLTSAGHLLNDGAPLTVSVSDRAGRTFAQSGWIRDGHIEMTVPLSPDDAPFAVVLRSALGTETQAGVMLSPTDPEPIRGPE